MYDLGKPTWGWEQSRNSLKRKVSWPELLDKQLAGNCQDARENCLCHGFRRAFLFRVAALPPSTLEQAEKLEQLRVLEHGCAIKVAVVAQPTCAVDNPEDVRKVEKILSKMRAREKSI